MRQVTGGQPVPLVHASSPAASPATSRFPTILVLLEATTLTGVARGVLGLVQSRLFPCRNHVIAIVARRATLDVPLVHAARAAGVRVVMLDERVRFDPRPVRGLRRLCEDLRPDIVESHAVKSHMLVYLSGVRRRQRWVAFHHGYTFTDLKTRAYNVLDRVTLRHADYVVTVADAFRRDLLRAGVAERRLGVVPNAVPLMAPSSDEARDRLRRRLGIPPDARIVAAAGRLSREKGHVDLLRAFAAVASGCADLHLIIAGEGPERCPLEAEARALKLSRVHLPGELDDIQALYGAADVCTLPSLSEGCPSVLLEAMAAGTPVVATSAGGIPEFATHGETALLVPPGDVGRLAAAVKTVLLDPVRARQRADRARLHVRRVHGSECRAEKIAMIHDHVLGREHSQRPAGGGASAGCVVSDSSCAS